jgi:hypothetical protein
MKNLFLALSLSFTIGAVLTLNSCKKETTEDDSISAQDETTVMKAVGNTSDDGSAASGQVTTFTGKTEGLYQALCGVTSIDSATAGTLILTYSSSAGTCFNLTRSGTITVTLSQGTHWQDVGAQLTITFNNFQVTDIISGATYTINGTNTVTNELGGLAWKIAYGLAPANDSTEHRIVSSNMSITFPNGTQRQWSFDRTRKWSNAGGLITFTEYTQNQSSVDAQGVNRFGNAFVNTIINPVAANNDHPYTCNFLPYQGELQHVVNNRTTTVTFGTNSAGVADGSPTVCATGFFISYVNANNGHSASRYVPY